MKIAMFTGSRAGWTPPQEVAVRHRFECLKEEGFDTLLHGVCSGSDENADRVAHEPQIGWRTEGYPGINWKGDSPWRSIKCHCDVMYPEDDYISRDHKMVDRAEVCVATPKGFVEEMRHSGTWSTIRYAKKQHKRLFIVYPDGSTIEYEPMKGLF